MGNVREVAAKRSLADALTATVRRIRLAEAEQLRVVCELVDAYRTVPDLPVPGAPQLRPSGADGTPDVDEFLVNEIAPLLGVSTASAWALIHDAINLRERHPRCWAMTQTGQVPVWQARQVAQACVRLSAADARTIDTRIAPGLASGVAVEPRQAAPHRLCAGRRRARRPGTCRTSPPRAARADQPHR